MIVAMTEVVATEEEATEMAVEDLIDMSRQEIVAAMTEVTKQGVITSFRINLAIQFFSVK